MTAGESGDRASVGRCLVVHPVLKRTVARAGASSRSPEARLEEAIGLALAIALDIVHADIARVSSWNPSTL